MAVASAVTLLFTVGVASAGAGPAAAPRKTTSNSVSVARATSQTITPSYMAIGDSYSSGEANSPFTNGLGCDVSINTSWPLMIAKSNNLLSNYQNFACSGAGIWSLTQPWSAKGQLSQISEVQAFSPSLVTITIGGNSLEQGTSPSHPDWGFSDIVTDCVLFNCSTDGTIDRAIADVTSTNPITSLRVRLAAAYAAIRNADSGGTVLVVGYPKIFPSVKSTSAVLHCPWLLSSSAYTGLDTLATDFNNTVAAAASDAGVPFISTLDVMNGHTLCTAKSWLQSVGFASGVLDSSAAHPIAPGQSAMAKAIEPVFKQLVKQAKKGWSYHVGWLAYGGGSPAVSYPGVPMGSPATLILDPHATLLPLGTPVFLNCWTPGADIYGSGGYPQDTWYKIAAGPDAGDYIYFYFLQESTPDTISTAIPNC